MRKITQEELKVFLRKHKLWLQDDPSGERADLYEADLYGADLRGANLREANLRGANLRGADLREADLRGANLRGADLRGANLRGADLYEADLRGADLREADLREANLREADLYGADLKCPIACPEKGSFTAFKKSGRDKNGYKYIIELEVPEDAKRCSATSRKCRCDKAKVVSITTLSGEKTDITTIPSDYDREFIYKVGDTVEVVNFNEDRWNECSAGIHFFITRQEAVDY